MMYHMLQDRRGLIVSGSPSLTDIERSRASLSAANEQRAFLAREGLKQLLSHPGGPRQRMAVIRAERFKIEHLKAEIKHWVKAPVQTKEIA